MTATVLPAPFKFSAIGKDVVVCAPVADITSVTRSEINAGTNINLHLDKDSGLTGFELSPQSVTMTDLGSGIGYPVSDGSSYGTGSINAHMAKTGPDDDVRSVFTEGDDYTLIIFDSKDTAGLAMDVFSVTCRPISKNRAGGQMLMVPVDIGNSDRDQTVPA